MSSPSPFSYRPGAQPPKADVLKSIRDPANQKGTLMCRWSIFDDSFLETKRTVQDLIFGRAPGLDPKEDRALGCFLGMGIGDALGAPLEFKPLAYDQTFVTGMGFGKQGAFELQAGQWTDDASMGLCVADSLLCTGGQYDPVDNMLRFLAWWYLGYNNAFWEEPAHSVGLGGNISQSFSLFLSKGEGATSAGDKNTSGVGSLMRLAAVPVAFHDNYDKALEVARASSLTTHQGEEAAEACRLMTHVVLRLMESGDRNVLNDLSGFQSTAHSVQCIANSIQEKRRDDTDDPDRNWNWRVPCFRFSPARERQHPGYVGSYALDALAMGLHCVWATTTFDEAVLKAANQRGDADSVAAVTGQIAGALYGCRAIPSKWTETLQKWDRGGQFALRAHLLFHKKWVSQSIPHLPPAEIECAFCSEEDASLVRVCSNCSNAVCKGKLCLEKHKRQC